MTTTARYHATAERPVLELWLQDDDGALIDLSSGYSFVLKIGDPGSTALLTKSSDITGAAGSGTEVSGVPNVTVEWAAGELDLAPGPYAAQLTATIGGLARVFQFGFVVLDTID